MDYVALGARISARRRELKLSQSALANAAGISLSFVGHIERGTRKLSLDTLLSIAKVLNTTPDELLHDSISVSNKKISADALAEDIFNIKLLLGNIETRIQDDTGSAE